MNKDHSTSIKSKKYLNMRTDHEIFTEILESHENLTIKISQQYMASNISYGKGKNN